MFEAILQPALPIVVTIAGLIGLAYGVNKLMKSKSKESDLLKYLALGTSIVIGLMNLLAIYEWVLDTVAPPFEFHWLTLILIFLAGSSMLAEPLRETPLAAIVAIIAFGALAGLFLLIADFSTGFTNPQLFGIINVPLWIVILIIVVIVGIVFLATVFTEFTIDRVLQLIGWAPVVIVFSALLAAQGILILLLGDVSGIWSFF
ncbi:MAG: hypothetical protein ACTSW1_19015 [Candidatus Hodarchaeales archaeon]